jgi:hypothetical protein
MSNLEAMFEDLRKARAAANPANGLEQLLIEMSETIGLIIERMDRMQTEIDQLKRAA